MRRVLIVKTQNHVKINTSISTPGGKVAKDSVESEDKTGSKLMSFRIPNKDVSLIEFFIELDISTGVVKSASEWNYLTVLAVAKQRLKDMTPESIDEEAKRRHDDIETERAKRLELYNTFVEPDS